MTLSTPFRRAEPHAALVPSRRSPGATARWVAITAVELVIVIHVVLTPMHIRETPYIGALFVVGNVLLFAAVVLMAGRRRESVGWALAGAVCAGEFAGFVLSRTVGLPQGYHETWAAAPEDLLGLASLACEVAFAVAALAYVRAVTRR
jgi:hypothetical protein